MASRNNSVPQPHEDSSDNHDPGHLDKLKKGSIAPSESSVAHREDQHGVLTGSSDGLQRHLSNRQVQLICLGASIGTAIFVSIGGTLHNAGPGNLFLAFLVHNVVVSMVNNSMAEMSVYMPVSGGFIRLAGKWVDDALGFVAGWNFFAFQAILIPFEITALSLVLSFWSDHIPVGAICGACIVLYAIYGEAEFYLSSGKAFLLFLLFSFTFVTMVGGNPQHDAYGFRNWQSPGAFREYLSEGDLGKFEGFLAALWSAAFTCVGPEYVSIVAAEAKHPRVYVKTAYKAVYWRLFAFFVGSALACGILVPSDDPTLAAAFGAGADSEHSGSPTSSPYVIAMSNMGVSVLPHIVTALLATTIFSAGNTYTYCATRTLYGLSLEGRAPKALQKVTGKGIPIYCFCIVMLFPFLSLLQMSSSSAAVLGWLINLCTATIGITFVIISVTYIAFHRACRAQNFDRSTLPYRGWFQPYAAWFSLAWMFVIEVCYGYASFSPFNVVNFVTSYLLLLLSPVLFLFWKYFKGTTIVKAKDVDLIWDAPLISAYEEALPERPTGFWREVGQYFRILKPRSQQHSS